MFHAEDFSRRPMRNEISSSLQKTFYSEKDVHGSTSGWRAFDDPEIRKGGILHYKQIDKKQNQEYSDPRRTLKSSDRTNSIKFIDPWKYDQKEFSVGVIPCSVLFIENIPVSWDSQYVRNYFESYGDVTSFILPKNPNNRGDHLGILSLTYQHWNQAKRLLDANAEAKSGISMSRDINGNKYQKRLKEKLLSVEKISVPIEAQVRREYKDSCQKSERLESRDYYKSNRYVPGGSSEYRRRSNSPDFHSRRSRTRERGRTYSLRSPNPNWNSYRPNYDAVPYRRTRSRSPASRSRHSGRDYQSDYKRASSANRSEGGTSYSAVKCNRASPNRVEEAKCIKLKEVVTENPIPATLSTEQEKVADETHTLPKNSESVKSAAFDIILNEFKHAFWNDVKRKLYEREVHDFLQPYYSGQPRVYLPTQPKVEADKVESSKLEIENREPHMELNEEDFDDDEIKTRPSLRKGKARRAKKMKPSFLESTDDEEYEDAKTHTFDGPAEDITHHSDTIETDQQFECVEVENLKDFNVKLSHPPKENATLINQTVSIIKTADAECFSPDDYTRSNETPKRKRKKPPVKDQKSKRILKNPTVDTREPDTTSEELKEHPAGCARAQGFYRLSASQKKLAATNLDSALSQFFEKGERTTPLRAKSSRSQRLDQRRLVSEINKTEFSDILRFNQLKRCKKQLRFSKSKIHDWGLFAMEDIDVDDMVIEYLGEIVGQKVADFREKKYEKMGIGSSYLFRLDEDYIIDATTKGNLARFINHCCDPNCNAKVITIDGKKRIVIYAKRLIRAGEEITYDYKFPIEPEPFKIPCLCGSTNCKGTLN